MTVEALIRCADCGDEFRPDQFRPDQSCRCSEPIAPTPQRPDECPDVAGHARPRALGDHRKQTRYRCPSCGFFCLLAPAKATTS